MVDIVPGNFYLTTGSLSGNTITGGTTVKVWATKVEHDIKKNAWLIDKPISYSQQPRKGGSTIPDTWVIDFLRIRRVITVTGYLTDETSETALTKKNNLYALMKFGGVVTAVWGKVGDQQTTTVLITDVRTTESAGDIQEDHSNPGADDEDKNYLVIIQLTEGTNK